MSGIVVEDTGFAGFGALRWVIDAVLVVVMSGFFAWKQARVHRRQSQL